MRLHRDHGDHGDRGWKKLSIALDDTNSFLIFAPVGLFSRHYRPSKEIARNVMHKMSLLQDIPQLDKSKKSFVMMI